MNISISVKALFYYLLYKVYAYFLLAFASVMVRWWNCLLNVQCFFCRSLNFSETKLVPTSDMISWGLSYSAKLSYSMWWGYQLISFSFTSLFGTCCSSLQHKRKLLLLMLNKSAPVICHDLHGISWGITFFWVASVEIQDRFYCIFHVCLHVYPVHRFSFQ